MKKESQDNIITYLYHVIINSLNGIYYSLKEEKSLHLWLISSIVITLISIILKINLLDAIIILSLQVFVLIVELLNTGIENTVDLITKEKSILAKRAKDCGSAASFLAEIIALIIEILIFIKYI